MNKKIAIGMSVVAVGLAAMIGFNTVSAHQELGGSTMVEKLSTKFNLNKDEVQKVFDENRVERQAQMQTTIEARLQQAVVDGKLTADQKTKIMAKHEEMKTFRNSLDNKTMAEVRTAMQTKHEEMEKWAEVNKIPEEFLRFGMRHGGQGHGMMKGM